MTSGKFRTVSLSAITINRETRQRRQLTAIPELAASIRETGLIHPIVVTPELVLVAGERRLTACLSLGWDQIPVQLTSDLEPTALALIELEENLKRSDLTWQDEVSALASLHKLKMETDPDWNQDRTAAHVNMSQTNVSKYLQVAENLARPEIATAQKLSVAVGLVDRLRQRAVQQVKLEILAPLEVQGIQQDGTLELAPRRAAIQNADFLQWLSTNEQRFNFVHCDFPYGVGQDRETSQGKAYALGSYDDSPDVYFTLLRTMVAEQDAFIAPSAHLMFWFSMDYYGVTKTILETAGWSVNPFPLIWLKSDNAGILPDSTRGPRRIYETALFASRGDRKIVRAVSNAFAAPTTKIYHSSEKSASMLTHFFRMIVDETTVMLDPTCGSGNSVKVAEAAGAAYSLGLELDSEFALRATENLADMA